MNNVIEGSYRYFPAKWDGLHLVSGGYGLQTVVTEEDGVYAETVYRFDIRGQKTVVSQNFWSAPEEEAFEFDYTEYF